jgi:hypothetical protein
VKILADKCAPHPAFLRLKSISITVTFTYYIYVHKSIDRSALH